MADAAPALKIARENTVSLIALWPSRGYGTRRSKVKKCAAGSWGRSGRSRTRSGDGEGWGR